MESVSSMVIDASVFNASNIYYGNPKTNPSGGKNVSIMDSSIKKQLVLSTPLMLTWGVNEWTEKDENDKEKEGGKKSYDLSIQFPRDSDANYEKCKSFLASMRDLETKILSDALVNSKEWFGKKHTIPEVVEALYTPMLRYPKGDDDEPDHTRAPSLRIKVPFWQGKFTCELYNTSGELIFPPVDNLESHGELLKGMILKGQNIATIIRCGGIWFAAGKFGVTWKLVQAVVQPRETLFGKCHIKLGAEDRVTLEEEVKRLAVEDSNNDDNDNVVSTIVEDSEESEDEDEDEEPTAPPRVPTPEPVPEPEPTPAPKEEDKPKRKRVVRKKAKE